MDYFLNGQANGSVADVLMANDFDVRAMRPYSSDDGRRTYRDRLIANSKDKEEAILIGNATATLRKDEWITLDTAVMEAAHAKTQAVADLQRSGLVYSIPNGIGTSVLQHQRQSDVGRATISMNGLREAEADRPVYDLLNLPLPIIHKDFQFDARELATSRKMGMPLDTSTAKLVTRKVVEEAEMLTLGVLDSYSYGGGSIYGYCNFPQRLTASLTLPATNGWTGATLVSEIIAMRQQSINAFHTGPWKLYFSPNWDTVLDEDYSQAKGDMTLRERIAKIRGIQDITTLDFLTGWTVLLVQQTDDVARLVNGMDLTTVQWQTQGGLMLHFKVMVIWVPQIRCDINNRTGIVHGVAA